MGAVTEEIVTRAVLEDGMTKVLRGISTEMARVGTAADKQREIFKNLDAQADDLGTNTEKLGLAFKGLLKETEDAEEAAKHLGTVLKVQTATGINSTEKAARELGDVLGGGTKLLRQFDAHAAKMAGEIDKIKDPAKRAELALKEVHRAIKRQNSIMGKARNKIQEFKVRLSALGPAFTAGAAGALAVGAAIGGVLVKAVKHYMANSAKMEAGQKRLNKAMDEFLFKLGGAVVAGGKAGSAIDALSGALEFATGWVEKNSSSIGRWVRLAARGGIMVAKVIGNIGLGLASLVSLVVEGTSEMIRKALGPIGELGKDVVHVLEDMGLITFETMQTYEAFFLELSKGAKADVSLPITEEIVNLQGELNALADGIDDVLAGGGDLTKVSIGGRKKKGKGSGGKKGPEKWEVQRELDRRNALVDEQMAPRMARLDRANTIAAARMEELRLQEKIKEAHKATDAAIAKQAATYADYINGPLQQATNGIYSMVDALAAGQMAMSDLGVASADLGANILGNLGLDLVSEAVGQFAQYLGKVFVATGAAFEALVNNPFALVGLGLGVIAAGALLKKFAGSGSVTPSAARSADSAAAGAVTRFGRDLFGQDDRDDRKFELYASNWDAITGHVRAVNAQDRERGRRRGYGTAPGFGL